MADTNKESLVQKLTDIADGFRTSRSLTDQLTLDEMAELAAVPITSGDNKLAQFIDGTLTEITAEDLEGLTYLRDYAFYRAPITSLEIPSTLKSCDDYAWSYGDNILKTFKYKGTIGDWASKIIMPNTNNPFTIASITNFYFLNNLGEYYLLGDTINIEEGTPLINSNIFYYCKASNLIIPSSVKSIGYNSFQYCSNLTNITMNEGLEEIYSYAFQYDSALQNLVIPNSVHTIYTRAFSHCSSLKEVKIGNGINTISTNVFANCSNLTDIYIDKPEGSISGSPWGATNATVHWNTPLPTN